jgi:hypothetical protein
MAFGEDSVNLILYYQWMPWTRVKLVEKKEPHVVPETRPLLLECDRNHGPIEGVNNLSTFM